MPGSCEGRAHLIRYADDYVACFQQEADARRFLTEMTERLAQFDLEMEPSKTAILPFGRQAMGRKARDAREPRTFSFLAHRARPVSHPLVEDSDWEPDDVTLQVWFCEEPGTNPCMAEIPWHRRETRRQQRTQTSA